VLVGPLRMTQSPTGPQPSRLPTPQYRSTHLRVGTHTHKRAHVSTHTLQPGSAQEADRGQASQTQPLRGGWCRPPRPHRRCHRGRGAPGPQSQLLAAAEVPRNAEASPAPI
ncbi:Hypothetical predicted protein, partial [Marmota monax]